ncbi:hypothetical protein [Xenorhabdus innexi]|uniref:DUF7823 domain-containing protein n=1 Tax=Xenorhabdus innexi TaxID=290109 RepID=A0A1N6MV45_9GAMM|nr:hypothetical protein [Xenorhabdus innexi]PHM30036.1 hypothetical protein Xinn_03588 [Xenorhabdus innexi]SIP72735.1 hypothetical protein XIS1_1650012 [Xenorhabdus innexi]
MSGDNQSDISTSETEYKVVLDITLGAGEFNFPYPDIESENMHWGYNSKAQSDQNKPPFGELSVIENNTPLDADKIGFFYWSERSFAGSPGGFLLFNAHSYNNQKSFDSMVDLFYNKYLYVTVNGITYKLGKYSKILVGISIVHNYNITYDYIAKSIPDAKGLGNILKETGETKRFCFRWCDN